MSISVKSDRLTLFPIGHWHEMAPISLQPSFDDIRPNLRAGTD